MLTISYNALRMNILVYEAWMAIKSGDYFAEVSFEKPGPYFIALPYTALCKHYHWSRIKLQYDSPLHAFRYNLDQIYAF